MNKKMQFRDLWQDAALGGICLAAVSSIYLVANNLLAGTEAGWAKVLTFILDAGKIVLCIWLMRWFMVRLLNNNKDIDRQDIMRLGTMMALCSALIYATFTMAYYTMAPDFVEETFGMLMDEMDSKLDANSLTAIENMQQSFPTFAFWGTLIYCFLFGWVLSAILSSRLVPSNPFANDTTDEN